MVMVLAVWSKDANLNGPAVTGILFSQPSLNVAGVALVALGYSGPNSDCQSPKGLAKVTTTS